MIEKFSYEKLKEMTNQLSVSSNNIRDIVEKYPKDLGKISDFCSSVEAYVNFINTSIVLYQDSEKALEGILKKVEH